MENEVEAKVKKLNKELNRLNAEQNKILKKFPPKRYAVLYEARYEGRMVIQKAYTLSEAKEFARYLTDDNKYKVPYYIVEIIKEKK